MRREDMVACGQHVAEARGLLRTLSYGLDAVPDIHDLLTDALALLTEAPNGDREKERLRKADYRARKKAETEMSHGTRRDTRGTHADPEVEGVVGVEDEVEEAVVVEVEGVEVDAVVEDAPTNGRIVYTQEADAILETWNGITSHSYQVGRDTKPRRHTIDIIKMALRDCDGDLDAAKAMIEAVIEAKEVEWRGTRLAHLVRPETMVRKWDEWVAALTVRPAVPMSQREIRSARAVSQWLERTGGQRD